MEESGDEPGVSALRKHLAPHDFPTFWEGSRLSETEVLPLLGTLGRCLTNTLKTQQEATANDERSKPDSSQTSRVPPGHVDQAGTGLPAEMLAGWMARMRERDGPPGASEGCTLRSPGKL